MNTNLLAIIKRIIAEQGEGILSDPKRLQPFLSDYAKNEPKEDRMAFGRAIEQGFYMELIRSSPSDRSRVKASFLPRLQAVTGLDASRCNAAIDLLEAAITPVSSAQPSAQYIPPVQQTQSAPPNSYIPQQANNGVKTRHGFTSFWLWLHLLSCGIGGVLYIYMDLVLLGGFYVGMAILTYFILQWSKISFYALFALQFVFAYFDPLEISFTYQLIGGLIDVVIIFAVLKIRNAFGTSAWDQLE
jgi:hypothetical protein